MSIYTIPSLVGPPVPTCPDCNLPLITHCTEHEGAWTYHPCRESLVATGAAPDDWWDQIDVGGKCGTCGESCGSHFARRVPGITIRAGFSVPQKGDRRDRGRNNPPNEGREIGSVMPVGTVDVKTPTEFRDCRSV